MGFGLARGPGGGHRKRRPLTVPPWLSRFTGRFTLEDVEAVTGPDAVLEDLSSLVDKSLVMKEDARGVACYRLHETMRAYAARRLDEAGDKVAVERRCTDYYVQTAQCMALQAS